MSCQGNMLTLCLIISSVIITVFIIKTDHPFRGFFLSALSGIGSLFAVNVAGVVTGVTIGINYITLAICSLGGIPSVIALLICRFIFSAE